MSDFSPRPSRAFARRQEGVALVVVLLFTVVILMIIVSTTATMSLGARTGGVNERAAYQALLTAESGLNTFLSRFEAKQATLPVRDRLRGPLSAASLQTWAAQQGLTTYSASGQTVTLKFSDAGSSVSLEASADGASSKKVVLQNYSGFPDPAFNLRIDAALASHPDVEVRGNGEVVGESGASSTGRTQIASVSPSGGTSLLNSLTTQEFALTVKPDNRSGALLLKAGDYVTVAGITAKVQGVNPTSKEVTFSTLGTTAAMTIPAGSAVERIDSAVTAPFTQALGGTSTIKVSDPSFFSEGRTVVVGNMSGTVEAINDHLPATDPDANTIRVKWASTGVPGAITEGTAIRRDVLGVVSAGNVDTDGKGTITNGSQEYDSLMRARDPFSTSTDTTSNDMFTYTFGQTKAEMLGPTGWLKPTSSFTGNMRNGGVVYHEGSLGLTSGALCGYGVLIVKGDLFVNGTCDEGFHGAIYVIGDYDQQGNATLDGALLAEGTIAVKEDTKIAGTGKGDGKIAYDRAALLDAGSMLGITHLMTDAGSWRQR